MEHPTVTIAIPTLNRIGYLKLALESAFQQTYRNIEVIVSNNVSDDGTAEYLASFTDPRLRILDQKTRLSMTQNWNACVAAATGEYFLLLSDDDLLESEAIAKLLEGFSPVDSSSPGIVYGGGRIIDAKGNTTRIFKESPYRESAKDLILAFFQGGRDLWCCSILVRTADIRPGYPENYKLACDTAVWITAALKHGSAVRIPGNLVAYRVHANLSAKASLEMWRSEYRNLHALVLQIDHRSTTPDKVFINRFGQVMERLDRSLIAGRINEEFADRKAQGLIHYVRYISVFLSPAGLIFLGKAIGLFLLSQNSQSRLRRLIKFQ